MDFCNGGRKADLLKHICGMRLCALLYAGDIQRWETYYFLVESTEWKSNLLRGLQKELELTIMRSFQQKVDIRSEFS